MKKTDVKIGGVYTAKVTDKLVPARIDAENPHSGWDATNLATGKRIRIKSAQRLRGEVKGDGAKPGEVADTADAVGTAVDGKHLKAAAKPASKKGKATGEAASSPTAAKGAKRPAEATKETKPKKAATRAKQGDKKAKRPSGLDAAARVLAESMEPMNCRQIVEATFEKGYWQSDGATPWATIYSAMIREIATKGGESRFKKVDRGRFAANK